MDVWTCQPPLEKWSHWRWANAALRMRRLRSQSRRGTRTQRAAGFEPFPGALDTVRWLRQSGCRLALVTNGSGEMQRGKIVRFGLASLFDAILIEGELGFGKPDPRIYKQALEELSVTAADTWMVGDNLDWDVAQPQRMGILGIWVDARGTGVPDTSDVRPDRVVRGLSDLRLQGQRL